MMGDGDGLQPDPGNRLGMRDAKRPDATMWLRAAAAALRRLVWPADELGLQTRLHEAVEAGNAASVDRLLALGADVNGERRWAERRGDGECPVHTAAARGHAAVLARLLRSDALDIDAVASEGWTALCLAAYHAHADAVAQLLRAGADPNTQCTGGMTPLHLAATKGALPAMEELLRAPGLRVDERNGGGETALHAAVLNNRPLIVRALLRDGRCDVNARTADQGTGHTPLRYAALNGRLEIVGALLDAPGIDPNVVCGGGQTALHSAMRGSISVNDEHATTIRIEIVMAGLPTLGKPSAEERQRMRADVDRSRALLIRLLRSPTIDPDIKDSTGRTARDVSIGAARARESPTRGGRGARPRGSTLLDEQGPWVSLLDEWSGWAAGQRRLLASLKRLALAQSFLDSPSVLEGLPRRCDGGGDLHEQIVREYNERQHDTRQPELQHELPAAAESAPDAPNSTAVQAAACTKELGRWLSRIDAEEVGGSGAGAGRTARLWSPSEAGGGGW